MVLGFENNCFSSYIRNLSWFSWLMVKKTVKTGQLNHGESKINCQSIFFVNLR